MLLRATNVAFGAVVRREINTFACHQRKEFKNPESTTISGRSEPTTFMLEDVSNIA